MPVYDVPDLLPVGSGLLWYTNTAPDKYLLCDGTAVSRTDYAALFAILGTTYGVGDGSTTFNLPDLRQRMPLGKAASGTGNSLGATGGAIDHDHSVPEHYHGVGTLANATNGAHTHTINHDHAAFTSGGSGTLTTTTTGNHQHSTPVWKNSSLGNNTGVPAYESSDPDHYTDSSAITSVAGNHAHTIPSHTHSIDVPNFSGTSGSAGDHTHTISGLVGATGGVDGDSAMTSGTNNPPFLVVNYIIKYQ